MRLDITELLEQPGQAAIAALRSAPRISLNDLRVLDLVMQDGVPVTHVHGGYVFFSAEGECLYVGKNSSQQHVERIPWHFALSDDSYGNYFLKRRRERLGLPSLQEAVTTVGTCSLLLLQVAERRLIVPLEKFLRLCLEPTYNSYKPAQRNKYAIELHRDLVEILEGLI